MKRTRAVLVGLFGAMALAVTACGSSSNPTATTAAGGGGGGTSSSGSPGTIVIGSANFQESALLAEIYAEALKAKGVKVSTKLNIGARETYIPGLKDGSIDLIPEYSGVLLQYFNKNATETSSADVYTALQKVLPPNLIVLNQSTAQDKDSISVTQETANKYHLKSIADLAPVAKNLVMGGPPEFQTRPDGTPGLKSKYGVTFKSFKSLDAGGPLTINALKNGQVDAADVFTTDPSIEKDKFVVLQDPKNLYAAQNILPLINKAKASDTVKQTLNAISAKLTTEQLAAMLAKVYDKQDPTKVAQDWLSSAGLG